MTSCVMIIPVAQLPDANAIFQLIGWGYPAFSVQLSADGSQPATHYGLRETVDEGFMAMLAAAKAGTMPPELVTAAYPLTTFNAVMEVLVIDYADAAIGHFPTAIAANNLMVCEVQN